MCDMPDLSGNDYLPELCRVFDISLDVLIMGADPTDIQALRL